MSNRPLFEGTLVRLAAMQQSDAEVFARFSQNSEYLRLLDSDPARLRSAQSMSSEIAREPFSTENFLFSIRTLANDELIGLVELDEVQWPHGTGWIGIGIGNPEYWDKGYGTDAMRVILRFAFAELALHRVSLNTFAYNPRAIHLYEKLGFVVEGRQREFLFRDGQRFDLIYMGLLREDWRDA